MGNGNSLTTITISFLGLVVSVLALWVLAPSLAKRAARAWYTEAQRVFFSRLERPHRTKGAKHEK